MIIRTGRLVPGYDGGGDTDDISGADGGREGGTEGGKTGNLAVSFVLFVGKHIFYGQDESANLQSAQTDGQVNTGCHDHDNQRYAPYDVVDGG